MYIVLLAIIHMPYWPMKPEHATEATSSDMCRFRVWTTQHASTSCR